EHHSTAVASPHAALPAADGASVPAADAVSTAWYCAAGTSNAGGAADETVYIGNLSPHGIQATLTVEPGGGHAPVARDLDLAAYEQRRVRVADVLATANPGVVVEVFGGRAVVEHEIRGASDLAMGACAQQPSKTWEFAAGSTRKGDTQTLAL